MEKWKLIGEEVASDLEQLDDLVFSEEEEAPNSQTDTDSDNLDLDDDLDSESNSVVVRILEEHLQIENYNYDQQVKMLEALKNVLEAGDLAEYYRIGVLLVYLSERRYVADELMDFLECY